MTAPVSRYLAPSLVGLSAVLAAANWYLTPARVTSWTVALLCLAWFAIVLWFSRRSSDVPARRDATAYLRSGVVFGTLMLAIPLSFKLAHALGAVNDAELSQRLTMATFGGFFMFVGNMTPKMLAPLVGLQCDGARMQAWQRFTGWTWMLTGLAFAIAWLALPPAVAKPVSMALLIGGVLLAMIRAVQMRRPRQTEA